MSKPAKHSIAVVVRKGNQILSIRRPEDDDELPGIWGLPAATCQSGESAEDVIGRIGRIKLGVELTPLSILAQGKQDRPAYILEMELWEARIQGTPTHREWKWVSLEALRPGAAQGSLCCELAAGEGGSPPPIEEKGRVKL